MLTGWKSQILWKPCYHKRWEVFWQPQRLSTAEELCYKSQLNKVFGIHCWFTSCVWSLWLFVN